MNPEIRELIQDMNHVAETATGLGVIATLELLQQEYGKLAVELWRNHRDEVKEER